VRCRHRPARFPRATVERQSSTRSSPLLSPDRWTSARCVALCRTILIAERRVFFAPLVVYRQRIQRHCSLFLMAMLLFVPLLDYKRKMTKRYRECAVGIDLCTTYSCVTVWLDEYQRVEIVHNDQGNRTIPSCVAFTNKQRLISDAAKNQATSNPDSKRLIGRKYSDSIIKNDMMMWPFKVILGVDDNQ
ncbi:hypothetical protein HN51_066371, partial [Arachis hypogaea]